MEVQPSIIGMHQSTYPLDAEIRYDTNIVNTGTKKIDNERFLLNYKFLFVNFFEISQILILKSLVLQTTTLKKLSN